MKTLYIVRHAKSSWDDPSLADFDRPLNSRGRRDAPRMGKRLKEQNILPDLIFSSPAKRALSTAKRIAEELGYSKHAIETNEDLYHASEEEILSVLQGFSDKHSAVLMVGHNPGLTDFVNALMNLNIFNIPTCGIATCSLDVSSWKEIEFGKGINVFYDFPKSKDD